MSRPRSRGSAIVMVLVVVLLLAGSLFATSFIVGLETRAARSGAAALQARLAARRAISLAVAEVMSLTAVGDLPAAGALGPWPDGSPAVTYQVEDAVSPEGEPAGLYLALSTSASFDTATAGEHLVLSVSEGMLAVWSRGR